MLVYFLFLRWIPSFGFGFCFVEVRAGEGEVYAEIRTQFEVIGINLKATINFIIHLVWNQIAPLIFREFSGLVFF